MRAAATELTPPSERILAGIDALPSGLWKSCGACGALVMREQSAGHGGTCPECGHYFRLTAAERIALLVDDGTFVEHHADLAPEDPLGFTDKVPYPRRLAKATAATGLTEGAVAGTAQLAQNLVSIVVMDFGFLGGSMGTVVGEKVVLAAEHALTSGMPLVAVCASGGARMQEGVLSLLQMSKTAAAIGELRAAGIPFISVLTDPTYGGVAASFAALGDVIIAESGARAGFAGPKVIQQTVRGSLPEGFQTADFLFEHGHIDLVAGRAELPETLRRLVAFFADAPRSRELKRDPHPDNGFRPGDDRDAWQTVMLARAPGRPTVDRYVSTGLTGFTELHGDRADRDDPAIVGGLAWLDRVPVVVVGHAKGSDTASQVRRNFGMPHPAGYRKAMRLYRLAERLRIPLITLVDTPGAYPGAQAEEDNQSAAIAESLVTLAQLRTPVITVVTGEGGSGGALALAVGDRLLVTEHATLSVISPEGCATILYGDAARAPEAARALRLRSGDLFDFGIADEVIAEPEDGAHTDPDRAVTLVTDAIRRHLRELLATSPEELLERRRQRLRGHGIKPKLTSLSKGGNRHD